MDEKNRLKDGVKDYLNGAVRQGLIPGAALAVVPEEGPETFYTGFAQTVPERRALTAGAVFDLASLTKVVCTVSCALSLMEEGLFTLNTAVSSVIRAFPDPEVTVRHLMTHTAGLLPDDKRYRACRGKEEMIRFICSLPPASAPGQYVSYLDFGYILLGEMIERAAGPLDIYARDHIFLPLRMNDTLFRPDEAGLGGRCVPTEVTEERGVICGEPHDGKAWRMGGVSGNAGLFSTVEDLARFVRMLLGGGELEGVRVLLPASVNALRRCYTAGLNERRSLGWLRDDPGAGMGEHCSRDCLFHTGFTGTSLYVDFERRCGIVLLTNRVHPSRENKGILKVRREIHDRILKDWVTA